jgi:hypothetical protein
MIVTTAATPSTTAVMLQYSQAGPTDTFHASEGSRACSKAVIAPAT